jgi:hypothetical protein
MVIFLFRQLNVHIISWMLILTVIPFALAAPVLVQEKHQAGAHIPKDVITVLGKRAIGDDLHLLWDNPWHFGTMWGEPADYEPPPSLAAIHVPGVHAPQPNPAPLQAPEVQAPQPNLAEVQVPEVDAPAPDLEGAQLPEVHVPPHDPAEFDRESMVFDDDAPPASPGSAHLPPPNPWPPESEVWYTPPSSPRAESYSDSDH